MDYKRDKQKKEGKNIFTTMTRKQIYRESHPWVFGSETLLVNCYWKSDHLLTIPFSSQERLHWQWLLLGHRVKLTSRLSPSRTIKSWTMRDTVNESYFNLPWAHGRQVSASSPPFNKSDLHWNLCENEKGEESCGPAKFWWCYSF